MATRENAEALGNPKTVLWRAVLLEAGWQPLKHYFLNFLFQIQMSKSDRLSLVHKIGWQDKHSPVGQGHLRFLYSFVHLAGPCEEQIWSVLAKKVSRSRTNLQVFLRNSFFCSNNQSEYLLYLLVVRLPQWASTSCLCSKTIFSWDGWPTATYIITYLHGAVLFCKVLIAQFPEAGLLSHLLQRSSEKKTARPLKESYPRVS